uniref:Isocitrate lyase n=2 Tax=Aegilops tauschii subsp. strangulata TaxID=200361 RepID=A0A453CDL6_AEGTS
MACYAALLHQPPASPSPCTSGRVGSCRVRPPPLLQRRAPPLSVRARISPRCSYAAAGESAGAGAGEQPAAALRRVLGTPGAHQAPACYDALSARLVERAGFRACFTSGFSISAARLGLPDVGLMSYGEMIDQGRLITEAVSIPVIGDADNGYGNCMNVKRTVKGFIKAGFAGIILEDQVSPKACGHTQGRKVVSREEAIMHIKAAVDARKESGSDIVIVARTDSRQALSLDEALWRARAFADAGADVLFIDALASREEMMVFCAVSPGVPKMANMLEGGGKTPILSPLELEEIGYKIIAYPLSLIGVSMRAMEDALVAIKGGRIPPPSSLPSFEEIKDTLGFNRYYEEEKRYVASPAQSSFGSGNYDCTSEASSSGDTKSRTEKSQEPIIDILPQLYDPGSAGGRGPSGGMWSRTLRLKITGRDGVQKIDARIPAGFLEGMTKVIPEAWLEQISWKGFGMHLWIRTTPRTGRYCLILRTAGEIGSRCSSRERVVRCCRPSIRYSDEGPVPLSGRSKWLLLGSW